MAEAKTIATPHPAPHQTPAQRRRPPQTLNFVRRAARRIDIYYRLLTMPWTAFFALLAAAYIAFNAGFALLYRLQDNSIANSGESFANAFFFSVQTMATIGYGDMRPATLYANLLVSAEVLLGLLGFALATGVIFARFSRPTARVLFSQFAVVTPHDGKPTLMFRAANERANRILEAQVTLTFARNEVTQEGDDMRRFHDLKVARSRSPLFILSWSVLHAIDESSPLHGATPDSLASQQAQIIVTIVGIDETLSHTVHARHAYGAADILFGRRLADILTSGLGPAPVVDYSRFHDTVD